MQANILAAPELAADGRQKIEWVRRNMPILRQLEERFAVEQPFAGKRIAVCIHLDAKTAYLALALRSGADPAEMRRYMGLALELAPHVVIDDGGDLVELLHESHRNYGNEMLGACEETTSGVLRARARAQARQLRFPVVLVNDA